ncbi:MAG: adenylate/guanylate cyclase domain-containing protein [Acidobacteriota bacterium]
MPPELTYEQGGERKTFVLTESVVRVGRSSENDLVIQDGSISRHHAEFWIEADGWKVKDLGSKNGTQVNQATGTEFDLKEGDEVILGRFTLKFTGLEEGPQQVALTTESPADNAPPEEMGTMFREAIDFSALAASAPAPGATSTADDAGPEQQVERLQKLLELVTHASEVLIQSDDLEELLDKVLGLVFDHLPIDRGFIMLWDEATQDLVPKAVRHRDEKKSQDLAEIKFSRTIAEKVYRDRVSVLTTDAQSDPRFAGGASIMALGIRSAMAAPLWSGDRVEGIIYTDTPLHVKAFDDFDLDLLCALGNHVAVALERARLQASVVDEQVQRQALARYHSPAVIERITSGGGETLAAEERDVTIIFADIVGFTSRCESMEPKEVAEMLNECFSGMAEAIFKHEGTLDKFIGDCLMAVFGAPLEQPDHQLRAVHASLDMAEALEQVNEGVPEHQRLSFRIGLHSGKVVAGDIGSVRRSDYTVLGANVNLASRIESSVAKAGQVVISDTTYEAVKEHFATRCVGEFQPKGISREVKAYEVLGRLPQASTVEVSRS